MHIFQLLPYVLSTSFSTHPKRQTWGKKRPPFTFFGTMRLTGNFEKKFQKKNFSQFLVFWELLLFFLKRVPNSPILWHFEVLLLFLSLRYGADLGRSRLVISERWILPLMIKKANDLPTSCWRHLTSSVNWPRKRFILSKIIYIRILRLLYRSGDKPRECIAFFTIECFHIATSYERNSPLNLSSDFSSSSCLQCQRWWQAFEGLLQKRLL